MSTARLSANASTRVFSYSSRSYSSLSARVARTPAASRSSIQSSSSLLATAARSNALASHSASLSFGVQSRLFSSTMTAAEKQLRPLGPGLCVWSLAVSAPRGSPFFSAPRQLGRTRPPA
ncbi:hypothetical protein PaG_05538 [Moesziomyces aphidis]|uniref:Uncharacterized protein n=1 Tax=Moesziomyces aphidis TaxID=84754 RepID=W3VFR6_MOEAP|nr:hypothetical protein PaG_05538 [Moesziomyces aphidis]